MENGFGLGAAQGLVVQSRQKGALRCLLMCLMLAACARTPVKGVIDLGGVTVTVYPRLSVTRDGR